MSRKIITVAAMSFLLVQLNLKADAALEIYLPREATVEDEIVRLGQISIVRGEETLAADAKELMLGRFSVVGQKIIVDRPTLLSRLASLGMSGTQVTLKGAEEVTVGRQQQTVAGADFVKEAKSFLQKTPQYASAREYEPERTPSDLVVAYESKDIEFLPALVGNNKADRVRVRVAAVADGKEIGRREVTFRLKYNCRSAVTLMELQAGSVISADNVKIVEMLSNHPEPAGWKAPYGLVTKQRLGPNTVVGPDKVVMPASAAAVKRNQNVVIQVETPGLLVTATGQAMQNGRAGECIKVKNVDSGKIIIAKVNEDGTVQPVL
jgi:flagella basal body P-ring formation protein FlgA